MWPSDLNYVGALAAAAAFFIFGAIWYMALSKPWMKHARMTEADVKAGGGARIYLIAALSSLLCAIVLAAMLKLVGAVSLGDHICIAGTLSLGLVVAAMAKHDAFRGYKLPLLAIDGGYDIIGFVIMSMIIWAIG